MDNDNYKFAEWLDQQIHYAIGYRDHMPKTKEENKYWDGKIAALQEVQEKFHDLTTTSPPKESMQ